MIIAIPLSSVVVGMIMLGISIRSWDGLVEDDYYKHGKEINRVLERDRKARNHAIEATLVVADSDVMVDLRHDGTLMVPATLELRLLHRTRSGLDRSVVLTAGPDGRYTGRLEEDTSGRWVVQLETGTWRVSGEAVLPADSRVELHAI
jgi:hypothetical protein